MKGMIKTAQDGTLVVTLRLQALTPAIMQFLADTGITMEASKSEYTLFYLFTDRNGDIYSKLDVIKAVRDFCGIGLKEAKDGVDRIEEGVPFKLVRSKDLSEEQGSALLDRLRELGKVE